MVDSGSASQERANFVAAFLVGFVAFSLLYSPQPILHIFTQRFGVPPHVSALAISLPTTCLAVSSILMIGLHGRVPLARLVPPAILIAALAGMVSALASSWWLVILARGVVGVAIGVVPASVMAFLGSTIAPERMGRAMSWYIAGCGSGGVIGRLASGLLTEAQGYQAALGAVAVATFAVGLYLLFRFPRETRELRAARPAETLPARLIGAARAPGAGPIYLLSFLLMSSFVGIFNYLSYLLSSPRFGLSEAGLSLGFMPLAIGTVAVPIFGRLFDRLGPRAMLSFSFLMVLCGALLTATPALAGVFVGITALALGAFSGHSSASATLARLPGVETSYASSIYMFTFYMGASLTGPLVGFAFHIGGWSAVVGFTLILGLTGLAVTLRFVARNPGPS
ncbi:MFS transporter [Alterinioella nitratireducens]|uniref:MFS transporter n=1 Tax=Alterinioella nitratireducens TaxID=2735915 RepID=UPI0015570D5F|nr:MFS transporter [Alterinioella nitratireducens]NPD21493.1 MFS transporter [Alterinioella nitratireducens]